MICLTSPAASILREVDEELQSAITKHPPLVSLHEAYAVILEELDEVKTEVWKNPRKHPEHLSLARAELIQVAAMAIRAIYDVADRKENDEA